MIFHIYVCNHFLLWNYNITIKKNKISWHFKIHMHSCHVWKSCSRVENNQSMDSQRSFFSSSDSDCKGTRVDLKRELLIKVKGLVRKKERKKLLSLITLTLMPLQTCLTFVHLVCKVFRKQKIRKAKGSNFVSQSYLKACAVQLSSIFRHVA